MPAEPADTTFPSRVKIDAYPVQELGGLVFAYLGPQPAPLLPNWDIFVEGNVLRDIGLQVVHCNWLQMQENDLDPATPAGCTPISPTTYSSAWAAPTSSEPATSGHLSRPGLPRPRGGPVRLRGIRAGRHERGGSRRRPPQGPPFDLPQHEQLPDSVHVPRAHGRDTHAARHLHHVCPAPAARGRSRTRSPTT